MISETETIYGPLSKEFGKPSTASPKDVTKSQGRPLQSKIPVRVIAAAYQEAKSTGNLVLAETIKLVLQERTRKAGKRV